ncbi:hypothetical protein C0995_002247, partial [Termitomyces sp. Mi166
EATASRYIPGCAITSANRLTTAGLAALVAQSAWHNANPNRVCQCMRYAKSKVIPCQVFSSPGHPNMSAYCAICSRLNSWEGFCARMTCSAVVPSSFTCVKHIRMCRGTIKSLSSLALNGALEIPIHGIIQECPHHFIEQALIEFLCNKQ